MAYYIYKDTAGYYRWRLKAANHEIIAISSEGYYNKRDCEHSIQLVKGSSAAPVYEV